MRGPLLAAVFFALLPLVFLRGPFFGVLMWFWVSLMSPQQLVWGGIFAAVPYALIVAAATLLSWAAARAEPKFPPFDRTTLLLLLLMVWISVTSLLGIGPPAQIFEKWQLGEKMLLMTGVAYALTTTRERLDQLILVIALSLAFFGVKGGIFAVLTGGADRVYGPPGTMIGDNNDLGLALTMVLPLLFYLRERYCRPSLKWVWLALIGLTFLGDVFTYSRGALVALSAMGAMLWWRSQRKLPMLALIAVAALGVWQFAPPQWLDRMATIETYRQDASAESRLYMWRLNWAMAEHRPLVGGGFHWSFDPEGVNRELADTDLPQLSRPRAPHSIWFEMLGDHGFVGLAIFVAIILGAVFDARWLVRHSRGEPALAWANHLGRMLQVALVGYCAGGTFLTQAMFDGFYALVIVAAAGRSILAAEVARRPAAAVAAARPVRAAAKRPLSPQPTA